MELDPENRPRLVRHGHDGAIFRLGVDDEVGGKRIAFDDERVIARRSHWRRASSEQPRVCVSHVGHFAMTRPGAANDAAAEGLADRLMPEAYAEERNGFVGADEIDDASGAGRG